MNKKTAYSYIENIIKSFCHDKNISYCNNNVFSVVAFENMDAIGSLPIAYMYLTVKKNELSCRLKKGHREFGLIKPVILTKNIDVKYITHQIYKQLRRMYNTSTILVLPSHRLMYNVVEYIPNICNVLLQRKDIFQYIQDDILTPWFQYVINHYNEHIAEEYFKHTSGCTEYWTHDWYDMLTMLATTGSYTLKTIKIIKK